jgi:hypothetical protein
MPGDVTESVLVDVDVTRVAEFLTFLTFFLLLELGPTHRPKILGK